MATDINQLMGEIIEDPDKQKKDIEALITGLLGAIIKEQSRLSGAQ